MAAAKRLLSIVQFASVSPFLMQTPRHSPRKEKKKNKCCCILGAESQLVLNLPHRSQSSPLKVVKNKINNNKKIRDEKAFGDQIQ